MIPLQVTLYLYSCHRFVSRSKALESKLKVTKIFDLVQAENPLSHSLLGGAFDFSMFMVYKVMVESVAITFLLYTFLVSYQSV